MTDCMGGDPPGPAFVTVRHTDTSGVALLRVVADLDLATAPGAEQQLATLLNAAAPTGTVILDFDSGTFVGVRGLRLLLDLNRRLRSGGRRLFVCAPTPSLERMVQILDLDREIEFMAGVHDALRAARN